MGKGWDKQGKAVKWVSCQPEQEFLNSICYSPIQAYLKK